VTAYETTSERDVQWTDSPVSVLGEVDGETLRVTDTAA
jgi:predicted aconitase with swiveling domain